MKKFTTITEYDLLNAAYYTILDKWVRESDRFGKSVDDGHPSYIARTRRDKYKRQLDELHGVILEMEEEARKETEEYNKSIERSAI